MRQSDALGAVRLVMHHGNGINPQPARCFTDEVPEVHEECIDNNSGVVLVLQHAGRCHMAVGF
ncbi:hypothetical protein GCM10009107_24410 [Ideonella azotifigens]|uniref:Uncharacterized protein n=1 Tax=Ideonella azotifigens TaxID=513160 RepID=A0ABN1K1H3_9BURK